MKDYTQYNKIFLYDGNNMLKKIDRDIKELKVDVEKIEDEMKVKIDRTIRDHWKNEAEITP